MSFTAGKSLQKTVHIQMFHMAVAKGQNYLKSPHPDSSIGSFQTVGIAAFEISYLTVE